MKFNRSKQLLLILGSIAFLVQGDNYAAAPLLIDIAKDLHLCISHAALSISAYMIPLGLFTLLFGPLADRYGKAKVLNLATLGTALFSILSATAFNLPSLCIFRAVNGAFAAAVLPVSVSLVGDSFDDSTRMNALGAVIGMMFLGGAVAPAIGGTLAFFGSWRLLYLTYGLAELVVAIIMLKCLEKRPGVVSTLNFSKVYGQAIVNRNLIKTVRFLFLVGFAVFGSFAYSGKFVQIRLGYNILAVGLLLSLFGLATAIGGPRVGTLKQKFGNKVILFAGILGGISWATLCLWYSPFLVALSLLGFGFAFIIIQSTVIAAAMNFMPEQRGTVMALASFNMFVGGGVGTFLDGRILNVLGFPPIFFLAGVIIFIVGYALNLFLNKIPQNKEYQI